MRMPFGKYKGWPLADVPDDYLTWVLENCGRLRPSLRAAIERRLRADDHDRYTTTSGPTAAGLSATAVSDKVQAIRRKLSLTHHPDRGGSLAAMQAVNGFADELLAFLARQPVGV